MKYEIQTDEVFNLTAMSDFFNRVYEVVKKVPKGKVITYGQVARLSGAPRCARQVGWALHVNPEQGVIPCHRVVFKDGSLATGFAFGGREVQKAMLEEEGVTFKEQFKVDMEKCCWEV